MPPIPPPPPPPPSLFGPQKGGSKPPPHTNERSKLLNDIEQGPRRPLKKTVTNDRSVPVAGRVVGERNSSNNDQTQPALSQQKTSNKPTPTPTTVSDALGALFANGGLRKPSDVKGANSSVLPFPSSQRRGGPGPALGNNSITPSKVDSKPENFRKSSSPTALNEATGNNRNLQHSAMKTKPNPPPPPPAFPPTINKPLKAAAPSPNNVQLQSNTNVATPNKMKQVTAPKLAAIPSLAELKQRNSNNSPNNVSPHKPATQPKKSPNFSVGTNQASAINVSATKTQISIGKLPTSQQHQFKTLRPTKKDDGLTLSEMVNLRRSESNEDISPNNFHKQQAATLVKRPTRAPPPPPISRKPDTSKAASEQPPAPPSAAFKPALHQIQAKNSSPSAGAPASSGGINDKAAKNSSPSAGTPASSALQLLLPTNLKFEKRNLNQITGATATAPPRPNQPPQVRGLAGMGAGIPSPPARSTSCFESLEQRFHFLSIDELPPPPKFQGFRKDYTPIENRKKSLKLNSSTLKSPDGGVQTLHQIQTVASNF